MDQSDILIRENTAVAGRIDHWSQHTTTGTWKRATKSNVIHHFGTINQIKSK